MRTLRIIRQALLDLVASGASVLLLYVAVQELLRKPAANTAMLGSMVPVTERKLPWLIVIAVVLLLLWVGVRAVGGRRGPILGAWRWLARVGFWWSVVAMLLFIGVAIYGLSTRGLSGLNWGFSLGCLTLVLALVLACGFARQRTAPVEDQGG